MWNELRRALGGKWNKLEVSRKCLSGQRLQEDVELGMIMTPHRNRRNTGCLLMCWCRDDVGEDSLLRGMTGEEQENTWLDKNGVGTPTALAAGKGLSPGLSAVEDAHQDTQCTLVN